MDLFELQAVLRLNADQYNRGITEAETTGTGFIERIGNAWASAKGKFQTVAAVLGPVIDMVEQAVDAYADYQQSSDGVRRMFGDMADRIIDNAKSAYRTAGLSMNSYLDTVLDFGQRMLDGLGGDTEAAADLANAAIIQMADNVAAFGTDYATVAGVYSSLSRGIYTTLDNLRLGYGGTREELERLMRDAEQFGGLEAGSLDINNFADIVRAIGLIQQRNNIAGTAEQEGGTTITGSLQALKASWENLKTTLADPNATDNDRRLMAEAFSDSLRAFLENLMPVITQVVRTLVSVMIELVPDLVTLLIDLLSDPTLFAAIITMLVQAIVTGLAGLIDILITGLISIFDSNYTKRGGSAFTQWGVYDWIREAFGIDVGGRAYDAEDRPPTTVEVTTGTGTDADADAILSGLMEMYGFGTVSGNYSSFRARFRDTFGDANPERLLTEFLGLSDEALTDMTDEDFAALEAMIASINANEALGNMEGVAAGMHQLYEAIQLLNAGNYGMEGGIDNATFGLLLNDETYAEIVSRIRAIGTEIDLATGARTVDIGFRLGDYTSGEDGSHASGLWSVPWDGYMARLHRDEMILNASAARDYREGRGGSSDAVVAAIEGLRNDMQHLQMVVGESVFGQTVVNYSGRRMNGYLGEAEDKAVAGYGWG